MHTDICEYSYSEIKKRRNKRYIILKQKKFFIKQYQVIKIFI
jgi:hypothetical protein